MKKIITFYHQDLAQKHLFQYISKHFNKKKFKIKFTKNFNYKSDIGFYAENSNNIKKINSKISFITLGGIDQGKLFWPNFWKKESWNKFDFGFLPSIHWAKMWKCSSWLDKSRPKIAMLLTGWPKSEEITKVKLRKKNKIETILYAPCFETDNKGMDVVNALENQKINLLVKHLPWNEKKQIKKFKDVRDNIKKMISYSKKKLKSRVKIINNKDNIMKYYNKADLLITDESSVMYEALLYNLPSLSCDDWPMRINNSNKPRKIKKDSRVCLYVKKRNLKKKINILRYQNKKLQKNCIVKKNYFFSYINSSAKNIVDFIETYLESGKVKFEIKPKFKVNIFKSKIMSFLIK
jgi:spore coat polysaccharide biosynthesis predicted glycosyltransferase SpsG